MGHTLAELAVHVKLHSKIKSKMHLPCIIAPSNLSPVFGSVARTELRQSRVRQISETPTVARARVEHEALGFSIRMHRIACAHARGTQPAPCTHLACAASARLTPKLLHTSQDPDTAARVLKGRCDARCAGSFCTRAALPNRFTSIVPQTLGIAAQQRCAPHH